MTDLTPMRRFDPNLLGRRERDAWAAYYQRRWARLLLAAAQLTRHAFGLRWRQALQAAWWVGRANMRWAPYPDNDPVEAEDLMRRVYALVARVHGETIDPAVAAELEIGWWHVHRHLQREADEGAALAPLVSALRDLYAHVYSVPAQTVERAAALRAKAMRVSDAWVADGAADDDPRLDEIAQILVRGYASLLSAVHRPRAGG